MSNSGIDPLNPPLRNWKELVKHPHDPYSEEWDKIAEDIQNARNMEKNLRCCGNCSSYFIGLTTDNKFVLGCAINQFIDEDYELHIIDQLKCTTPDNVCEEWEWDEHVYKDREKAV